MVVPSSYEGYGVVYVEGMGFGLPAIGTTAGAAQEIITHGEDGFLAQPDDSAAVAHALRVLITDRERLAQMGQAARRRYQAQPGWAHTCAQIREFLVRIADRT
jgi:glycosyltransferase involved in cell wall biosynthesis